MVSPTRIPATASGSSGHHGGSPWKPTPLGRSVNTQPCISLVRARNPQAAAETGTPSSAASTSRTRYPRVRSAASGLADAAAAPPPPGSPAITSNDA